MAYYSLRQAQQQARGTNGMLVLPPLLMTLVFCYAFVLMQPHPDNSFTAASAHEANDSSDTQSELPVIAYAKQQTLTAIPDNSKDTNPTSRITATPQASINASTSLQAASPSNGHKLIIKVPGKHKASHAKKHGKHMKKRNIWIRYTSSNIFQF